MVYIISIGDTVRIKSSGVIGEITAKTVNQINGEWENVWFINNDYSNVYTSEDFEPIKGKYY